MFSPGGLTDTRGTGPLSGPKHLWDECSLWLLFQQQKNKKTEKQTAVGTGRSWLSLLESGSELYNFYQNFTRQRIRMTLAGRNCCRSLTRGISWYQHQLSSSWNLELPCETSRGKELHWLTDCWIFKGVNSRTSWVLTCYIYWGRVWPAVPSFLPSWHRDPSGVHQWVSGLLPRQEPETLQPQL